MPHQKGNPRDIVAERQTPAAVLRSRSREQKNENARGFTAFQLAAQPPARPQASII